MSIVLKTLLFCKIHTLKTSPRLQPVCRQHLAQRGPISESYEGIKLLFPPKPAPDNQTARGRNIAVPVLNISLSDVLHTESEGFNLPLGHCAGIFEFLKSMKSTALLKAVLIFFLVRCCFPYKGRTRWHSVGTGPEEKLQRRTFRQVFHFDLYLA